MLRCIHCDYDLAGLVKDAALVVCPECGRETPRECGGPVSKDPTSRAVRAAMGRAFWVALFAPAFCIGVTLSGLQVLWWNEVDGPTEVDWVVHGGLAAALTWFVGLIWSGLTSRLNDFERGARVVSAMMMGLGSAFVMIVVFVLLVLLGGLVN